MVRRAPRRQDRQHGGVRRREEIQGMTMSTAPAATLRVMGLLQAYSRRDNAERELRACQRALEEDLEIIDRCCEMEVRHNLENRVRQAGARLDAAHGRRGSGLRHEPRRRLPQALWTHGG
jgi:hypothetical protein